jgi:hypothetical protein
VASFVEHNFCNNISLPGMGFVWFVKHFGFAFVNTLRGVKFFVKYVGFVWLFPCLYGLFDFSLKAEARLAEWVDHHGMALPPPIQAPLSKKKKQDVGAPRKANNRWALCSVSGRGHGRGSAKVKTSRVLLDVEAGASDDLPPLVKQSFKEDHYSPSTGMEESEWKIMLEQFIAMGVVVKDKVINIDSD